MKFPVPHPAWLLLVTLLCAHAHEVAPAQSPAGPGAMGSALTQAPDGTAYLSWLEPLGDKEWTLKFSRLEAGRWSEPRLIAKGADWFVNWADFPVLTVQKERLTAVWFVNNPASGGHGHHEETYRALHSSSADGGRTWSPPQPVTRESDSVEFVALQPLRDGRLLAAWLDGRNGANGQDHQSLHARVLGEPGPDTLVDDLVCDCCQLSFVPTTDGGALLAYRGRTAEETRDMRLARFDGRRWGRPTGLHADGWRIAACPVNGPQLAECGDLIGAVWFTSPDSKPRVLARVSDNAGESFGPVARIDLGRPQGRVDSVMLPDGTFVLVWLEMTGKETGKEGGIYLRTLALDGKLSEPQMLAASSTSRMSGFPRMILTGRRQLLLTYTRDTKPTQVVTLKVDLN